ncbi:Aim7p [Ascoidea rubescens DSM 1968]|uniref:Glia maturation factor beta n=1 Tax=Ascoidea rubescens DSM 1968 TaxID=1344418 RepID=A0A1D2VP67_9ASCO|nr:glia maturation factor beta [Ascoidea rubescens DSM 1968]ODV63389.1 glia maturation factor beta [Ascoidea rubescens DSM 1968]
MKHPIENGKCLCFLCFLCFLFFLCPATNSPWQSNLNIYSFSEDTLKKLRKFRFSSARASTMQAMVFYIDDSYDIKPEDLDAITSIDQLVEELPENKPRFVVLSYPLTLKDGRKSSPLVLVYYLPPTSSQKSRMTYAAAIELFRDKAGVSKLIEVNEEEDFEDIEEKLV